MVSAGTNWLVEVYVLLITLVRFCAKNSAVQASFATPQDASNCEIGGFSNLSNVVLTFEPEESVGFTLDWVKECAVWVAPACTKEL